MMSKKHFLRVKNRGFIAPTYRGISAVLIVLAGLLIISGCNDPAFQKKLVDIGARNIYDQHVEIQSGQFRHVSYTPSKDGDFITQIEVKDGPSVNVDLLPAGELEDFRHNRSYKYYESHRAMGVVETMLVTPVKANTDYILVVEQNDRAFLETTRVHLRIDFWADTEKK